MRAIVTSACLLVLHAVAVQGQEARVFSASSRECSTHKLKSALLARGAGAHANVECWVMLEGPHLTDEGLSLVAKHIPSTVKLSLSGCVKVGRVGLENIAKLTKLASLTIIDSPFGKADLSVLSDCRSLRELALHGTWVSDEVLSRVGRLRSIKTLVLASASATGSGFASYQTEGVRPARLNTLILKQSKHDIVSQLSRSGLASQLTSLVLMDCPSVTDASLAKLSRSATALEELELVAVPVTERGIEALSKHGRLRHLLLARIKKKISTTGLERLKACKSLRLLTLPEDWSLDESAFPFKVARAK